MATCCPYCGVSSPTIYQDGKGYSFNCCSELDRQAEKREDLIPFEWNSVAANRKAAKDNWERICKALDNA
jgi:hypothetical protein